MNHTAEKILDIMSGSTVISGTLTTVLFLVILIAARNLLVRGIRGRTEILSQDQRRWITTIRNISLVALVIGIFFIWAPQLHTLALSLTAVAVALVVAFKEMLLCWVGALVRVSSTPFKVGDWIRLGDITGEIVDLNMFYIELQELDAERTWQFTGRNVKIPNSKIFTLNIESENFRKKFQITSIPITIQYSDVNPERAAGKLMGIAERHYAPYREEAQRLIRKTERRAGVKLSDGEPAITLRTTELGHTTYVLQICLPTRDFAGISAAITGEFLGWVYDGVNAAQSPAA